MFYIGLVRVCVVGGGLLVFGASAQPLLAQSVEDDPLLATGGASDPLAGLEDPLALVRDLLGIDGASGAVSGAAPNDGLNGGIDNAGVNGTQVTAPGGQGIANQNLPLRPAVLNGQEDQGPGGEAEALDAGYLVTGFDSELETVRTRRREELDPIGLRAGSFTIFPTLEISATSSSNLFRSAIDAKSDVKGSLKPSLLVRSDWSRHALSLTAEGEWGRYATFTSEDPLRGSVAADMRADITRFSSAGLRLSYGEEQEGRGSADAVAGAVGPTRLRNFGLEGNLSQRFNRLVATLRGGHAITDYDDVDLVLGGSDNNDDRDVSTNSAGLRLAYEVSPATAIYGDISTDWRDYRQRIDDDGFERSSRGFRGAVGANVELFHVARLDAEVGYVTRDYDDARLDSIGDFTVDGKLTWAATPLTTIRLGAGTAVGETTVADASARVTRSASVGVDHELLRHFIIGADVAYENETIRGVTSETDTITASANAEYWLSRYASLVGRVSHEVERPRDTIEDDDVAETIVSVGVKLRR